MNSSRHMVRQPPPVVSPCVLMMNVVTAISGSHNIRQRTRRTAKSKAAAMAANPPKFADMKEHAKAMPRASSAAPTPPPGLSPPLPPPPVPVASKIMKSGEQKFAGPWIGYNSASRRSQVQFAKCLVTVLRQGYFKCQAVPITYDGWVLLDEICKVLQQGPADIINVGRSNNITTKTKITKTQ